MLKSTEKNSKLINGRKIRDDIVFSLKTIISQSPTKKICFVSFGSNYASQKFVELKISLAHELGIQAEARELDAVNTKKAKNKLQDIIEENFDGIVIQLPIDSNLDTDEILNSIPEKLDIDVLSEKAKINFLQNKTTRIPPVAFAVQTIFEKYKITTNGKKIVILGRGRLVGEPVSSLFNKLSITHLICDADSSLSERESSISQADIIISGIGQSHFIKPEMLKKGVVLIDAGTSEQNDKLVGDFDPSCLLVSSLMTPVPGGLGPITIVGLFANLFRD